MEPPAEMKKIGWATDDGGSSLKFFKMIFILTWNHGFSFKPTVYFIPPMARVHDNKLACEGTT